MNDVLNVFLKNPWFYLLGLILAGTYFYFKRKFENLADKEDVVEITQEVESIKKEFSVDLEKLKNNLEINRSKSFKRYEDIKGASYELWLSLVLLELKINKAFQGVISVQTSSDYIQKVNSLRDDYDIAKSKFLFFKSDDSYEEVLYLNQIETYLIDVMSFVNVETYQLGLYMETKFDINDYPEKLKKMYNDLSSFEKSNFLSAKSKLRNKLQENFI